MDIIIKYLYLCIKVPNEIAKGVLDLVPQLIYVLVLLHQIFLLRAATLENVV